MKRGVVITTSEYTSDFLKDCLESIKQTKYPVMIVSNGGYSPDIYNSKVDRLIINNYNGWELAGIQRGKDNYDEFVALMDTTIVKDISLFDKLFAIKRNVVLTKGNFHYMGKFVSKDLPNLPIVRDKQMAVYFESRWLDGKEYKEFEPDLPVHTNNFEVIHGQKRMVLENQFMKKWKGTWVESPEHPIPK